MNYIDKLLQGKEVEWKKLGEVAELKRGTTITAKNKIEGNIPVISGGQQPAYYNANFNRKGETITIAGSGAYAGFVMFWNEPIFVSDAFSVKPDLNVLNTKYVFHFLLNNQFKIYNLQKGSGVPHVYPKDLAKLQIPIPPLSVQQEIVAILDKFTELTAELIAELNAELTTRKKQYAYYREELFRFEGKEVEWRTFGDLGEIIRGNGLQKSDFTESGVGCIHYGQIYTYYGTSTVKTKSFVSPELALKLKKVSKGDLIITNTSENVEDVCKAVAWLGEDEIVTGGHACILKHKQNPKYIAYYTQISEFYKDKRKFAKGTKVMDVSAKDLAKIKIPILPIQEQERIVGLLDQFDETTKNIVAQLEKEIELRNKQYEYYRNQLLMFNG